MVRIEDLLYSCLEAGAARDQRLDELCQEHPVHAGELRRMVGKLGALGFLGDGAAATTMPFRVGAYQLEEPIGRGGMGIVYRARQPSLGDRRVAVKMIRPDVVADARAEARFLREALLASKLDHPSLCPVLDFGRHEGMSYLVMPLVEGSTLAQRLESARAAPVAGSRWLQLTGSSTAIAEPPWARIVAMVEKLARGLHAAHGKGLVHRDVKPGNVMIRPDGEPVLLDFGLARDCDDGDTALTASREVVGTPAYMAPEQIEPRGRRVDARTDVHALGVLLYECLALRLPYEGASREQLAWRILAEPPLDVRRHQPAVPRDLAVVLQVALDKLPDRRYASAQLFADDLQRVHARAPILARRPRALVRAWRWVERNPWPTAAGVALLLGLCASLWLLATVRAQGVRARALALDGASRAAAEVDQSLSLLLAEAAVGLAPDVPETFDQLQRAVAGMREVAVVDGFVGGVAGVGFSRDGERCFWAGGNGLLVCADRSGRTRVRRELGVAVEQALPVAVDSGLGVVLACADGRIRLWTPEHDPEFVQLGPAVDIAPGALRWGERGAVSRDGKRVLLGTNALEPGDARPHGRVLVLSIPDGRVLRDFKLEVKGRNRPLNFCCGAFAGDDDLLIGGGNYWVQYFRDGNEPVFCFQHPAFEKGLRENVTRLAVSGAGDRAVAMVPGRVRLLSCCLTDGSQSLLEEQIGGISELVARPDGDGFATGAGDGALALWRFGADETRPRLSFPGHQAKVGALAFAADGGCLVSGSDDSIVRPWDLHGRPFAALVGCRSGASAVAVDPAAGLSIAGDRAGSGRLWRLRSPLPQLTQPQRLPQSFGRFCFGRDRIWIGDTMTGKLWQANFAADSLQPFDTTGDPSCLQIGVDAADQRLLVGRNNSVELRATAGGELLDRRDEAPLQVVGSDLLADGSRAVVVTQGGGNLRPRLLCFDLRQGRFEPDGDFALDAWVLGQAYLNRADLGADGRTEVVCRLDGSLRLYDLAGEPVSPSLPHCPPDRGFPYRGTLSTDGTRLLSAGTDGCVKLWTRAADGSWRDRVLTSFDAPVRGACFDAAERRVVAGSDGGVLRVLDLDGRVLRQIERRGAAFHCVRFRPDGRAVVATTSDGALTEWPLDVGELLVLAKSLHIRELTADERARYGELLAK